MEAEESQRQAPPKSAPPMRMMVLGLDICIIIGILITGLIVGKLDWAWFAKMLVVFGCIAIVIGVAIYNGAWVDPRAGPDLGGSFSPQTNRGNIENISETMTRKAQEYTPYFWYFLVSGLSLIVLGIVIRVAQGKL